MGVYYYDVGGGDDDDDTYWFCGYAQSKVACFKLNLTIPSISGVILSLANAAARISFVMKRPYKKT